MTIKSQNILSLKEFKKRKLNFFSIALNPKYSKYVKYKINRIPKSFLEVFDQKSYLYANADVRDAILKEKLKSALEHFILYGYDEVKEGKRRIGNEFPFIKEEEYVSANLDIKSAFEQGKIHSPFAHFIQFGYKEFQNGTRKLKGDYLFSLSKELREFLFSKFDSEAYLLANADIAVVKKKEAWEHFLAYGIDEIRKGKKVFNPDMPFISECEYVMSSPDIFEALKNGTIVSPGEHFFKHGMWEVLEGTRKIKGADTYQYYEPLLNDEIKRNILNFKNKPLVSIIMLVDTENYQYVKSSLASLKNQWYEKWELHIVYPNALYSEIGHYLNTISDNTIRIHSVDDDENITHYLNSLLPMLNGEFLLKMYSCDLLTIDALYEVVLVINAYGAEFVYSDEDVISLNNRCINPNFKPDFSLEMIMSTNYLGYLTVVKKSLLHSVGAWDHTLNSCQDYDLVLKIMEKTTKIAHIDKVLYHRRVVKNAKRNICEQEIGKIVLKNALKRRNIFAEVTQGLTSNIYRVKYPILGNPLVSIVIPFKDKPNLLKMCIDSILTKSTYQNFEIIGISNNSTEKEIFLLMQIFEEKDKRVHFYQYNEPFNYSAINNYAVDHFVHGEHIILLNNDIEIISPSWIEAMLECSQKDKVAAVGAKLYYHDNTIQHAGVIIGIGDSAGHAHRHFPNNSNGYQDRLNVIQNYSAVTGACLMVKTSIYHQLNGLDEKNLQVAFNDVDFCLRAMEKGYRNVYTPYAEAYHYESISRGYEDTAVKIQRFRNERGYLQERHAKLYEKGDSYYNKNLTFESEDFSPGRLVSFANEKFIGKDFEQHVSFSKMFSNKKHEYLCIFAHYDKDNMIDPYVIYYLQALSYKFDILFVSTAAGLSEKDLEVIAPFCIHAIIKANTGYDFGAWKTGLDFLGKRVEDYSWLTLCNDSMYGPFYPIKSITKHLDDDSCDIFPLSENFERKRHFQSYFVSYSKKVFMHDLFKSFWKNLKIFEDKTTLINKCEIDFSNQLISSSLFRIKTFVKRYDESYVNIVQFYWKEAIQDGFPFMKIELLTSNPSKINVKSWESVLNKKSNYPQELIYNHIKRLKK